MVIVHSNSSLEWSKKNIVLIGFMGVGKTTIGFHLAQMLSREFIDVDREIEKRHELSIPQIFSQYGEQKFRQMEKEFILDLCDHSSDKVLSLGGGAFLQEEIRQACMESSIVVSLEMSWEAWKERLPYIMDNRPILQNKSLEEIEKLYYARQAIYELNHLKINTEQTQPEQTAERIIHELKLDI